MDYAGVHGDVGPPLFLRSARMSTHEFAFSRITSRRGTPFLSSGYGTRHARDRGPDVTTRKFAKIPFLRLSGRRVTLHITVAASVNHPPGSSAFFKARRRFPCRARARRSFESSPQDTISRNHMQIYATSDTDISSRCSIAESVHQLCV